MRAARVAPLALAIIGCFPQFGVYGEGGGGRGVSEGSGAGTTSSAPCVAGPEDCLDGCDNDGNGAIDCADPACGEFVCVPSFPAGWDGAIVLSTADAEPSCPTEFAAPSQRVGEEVLDVAQATCACSCGPASGATCSGNATLQRYGTMDCSDAPATFSVAEKPACTGAIGQVVAGRALLAPSGGSCVGQATLDNPGFTSATRTLCQAATTGAGCSAGVCAPRPPSGFEGRLCVMEPGDVPCTSPDYAVRTVVFTGPITDERACPTCACDAPTGASCEGFIQTYPNACMSAAGGVTLGGSCQAQSQIYNASGANYTVTSILQGACTPVDPAPAATGGVVGQGAITVCCSGLL